MESDVQELLFLPFSVEASPATHPEVVASSGGCHVWHMKARGCNVEDRRGQVTWEFLM